MRVLVTGAGGYIGNILTDLLIKKGHEVVALDRFLFGETLNDYPDINKIKADIRPENSFPAPIADIKKVKSLVCWEPRLTLAEGLKITVNWFKQHIQLYQKF